MKILIINHYAGSPIHGMEYRPYYMAKNWVKSGHNVTIVAASFSHVRQIQPLFNGSFKEENFDGIRYIWLKTLKYHGNGASRVLNIFTFVTSLFLRSGNIAEQLKPDVVIASSTYPLDMIAARRISKKAGAKLIFEVHDLWPLSPIVLGKMSKLHPFIMLMQWAENRAYQWSDKVVSILPLAKEHMVEHGMAPEKFVHIPNGIVLEEWTGETQNIPEEHEKELIRLRKEGKFLVCYAGAHGLANALESFVRSAELLKDTRIQLVLVGDGPLKKNLVNYVKTRNLKNVTFLPPVSKKAVPTLLEKMDVLFFSLQRCAVFKFGISPNKLIDYMMAGKPVIHAVEAGNDMVRDAGCGISVEPEKECAFTEAMKKMAEMPEVERTAMGQNGKRHVTENHDYAKLAGKFLDVLKEHP